MRETRDVSTAMTTARDTLTCSKRVASLLLSSSSSSSSSDYGGCSIVLCDRGIPLRPHGHPAAGNPDRGPCPRSHQNICRSSSSSSSRAPSSSSSSSSGGVVEERGSSVGAHASNHPDRAHDSPHPGANLSSGRVHVSRAGSYKHAPSLLRLGERGPSGLEDGAQGQGNVDVQAGEVELSKQVEARAGEHSGCEGRDVAAETREEVGGAGESGSDQGREQTGGGGDGILAVAVRTFSALVSNRYRRRRGRGGSSSWS